MKKLVMIVAGLFVVGVVVLVLSLSTIVSSSIKFGVEEFAPVFTGAPVALEEVDISIFSGTGSLKGLVVGNPEGFVTDCAIKLGEAAISIDVGTITSDVIVINEILIDGPEITYEGTMDTSNIKAILANIEKATQSTEVVDDSKNDTETVDVPQVEKDRETVEIPQAEKDSADDAEVAASEESGKKIIINNFIIRNGKINISSVLLGGKIVSVPLPAMHLKDIGKDSDGASPAAVLKEIMGEVDAIVGSAAAVVLKPLEALKKGQEAITEGAKKLGESLGGGTQEIGDAVEQGTKKLLKGLGGFFGGDK